MYSVWFEKELYSEKLEEWVVEECLFISDVPNHALAERIALNLNEEFGIDAWLVKD